MSLFSILTDSVQMRLSQDGLSTLVGAQDWDPSFCLANNVYVDGVTGTAFLLPACLDLTGNWTATNTGIYAKIPPTDFTLTPVSTDPNWSFPAPNPDGAQFSKYSDNTGGAGGLLNYSVNANQAIVVEVAIGQGTSATDNLVNVGYSATGDATAGVAFKFYADTSADVYISGSFLGHFTCSGQNAEYGQTDGQISSQTVAQYIKLLIIPCREREILVLSSNGGGFSFICPGIPEGTTGAVITPAEPLWFFCEAGVDMPVRLALCQYAASGNAIGKQSFWRYDPGATPTGGFQSWIDADIPTGTTAVGGISGPTVVADGVNPFAAYVDNSNGVSLNVALSAGSTSPVLTPFVYAARGYTLPVLAQTVGPALEVINYALDLSYEASDSISGTRVHLTLKDPKAIVAAGVTLDGTNKPGHLIQSISNRPWQIYDPTGTQILEGMNSAPKLEEGIRFQSISETDPGVPTYGDQTATNLNERVVFEIRDSWMTLENFIFKDQYPLDGLTMLQAMTLITDQAGVTDSTNSLGLGARTWNMSASLGSFVLPAAGNVTDSDFNNLIESGDKGSEWVDKLFKTYAANAFLGFTPMGGWNKPTMLTTADLPSSPALTLYDSVATATAQGVMAPTYVNLFRQVDVQMLEPEANDIYVQGKDYRTQRPILVHQFDTTNADPTIIPAARTPQWLGERRSYAWNDPGISTIGAAEYAEGLLYSRLTIARSLIEIETEFSPLLFRGALVKLYFLLGGGVIDPSTGTLTNPITARVKTISAKFTYTGNDGRSDPWRPTKYVLQFGPDASILNTHSTNAKDIFMEWAVRAVSKSTQKGDANDKPLFRRPLLLQDEM